MNVTAVQSQSRKSTWEMSMVELARVVAEHRGYTLNGNVIRDERGRNVAVGYPHLATKMHQMGWIKPGVGINWARIEEHTRLARLTRTERGVWQ